MEELFYLLFCLPFFCLSPWGGSSYCVDKRLPHCTLATISEREAHCIVSLGPGTVNWTTGAIEIGVLKKDGGEIEKEVKNVIPRSHQISSAIFTLSSFGHGLSPGRLEPHLNNLEEQAALDDAKQGMARILEIFAHRHRQRGGEASSRGLVELKSEIVRKVKHAEILFSGKDVAHQTLILRSTIFGEFLNLIFPPTLLKIPDIEVIDPENQYGEREKLTGMVVDAREIGFEPILFSFCCGRAG